MHFPYLFGLKLMKLPVILLLGGLLWPCLWAAGDAAPVVAPANPTVMFESLSRATKPLWRQLYRKRIERNVNERERAALCLGAVSADLAVAAMARDAQQLRNLVQDEQALEKMLSVVDKMEVYRQHIVTQGDEGDWPQVGKAVEKNHDRCLELLISMKDSDLATLVVAGRWLRTWQVSAAIVTSKNLLEVDLAIGSPELLAQVLASIEKLSEQDPSNKTVRQLHKRVRALDKIWRMPIEQSELPGKHKASKDLLDDAVGVLIQGELEKSGEKVKE